MQYFTFYAGNCNQSEISQRENTSRQDLYLNEENESPNAANQSEISQKKNTYRQEVYLNKETQSLQILRTSEESTEYSNKSENGLNILTSLHIPPDKF